MAIPGAADHFFIAVNRKFRYLKMFENESILVLIEVDSVTNRHREILRNDQRVCNNLGKIIEVQLIKNGRNDQIEEGYQQTIRAHCLAASLLCIQKVILDKVVKRFAMVVRSGDEGYVNSQCLGSPKTRLSTPTIENPCLFDVFRNEIVNEVPNLRILVLLIDLRDQLPCYFTSVGVDTST